MWVALNFELKWYFLKWSSSLWVNERHSLLFSFLRRKCWYSLQKRAAIFLNWVVLCDRPFIEGLNRERSLLSFSIITLYWWNLPQTWKLILYLHLNFVVAGVSMSTETTLVHSVYWRFFLRKKLHVDFSLREWFCQ